VTAVTKKLPHTSFTTNPAITKFCVGMISHSWLKMGGDMIMLALHTRVAYFPASVTMPISL